MSEKESQVKAQMFCITAFSATHCMGFFLNCRWPVGSLVITFAYFWNF